MRVAHNITALNAWRQLSSVADQLGKSVERLSSGYRINRAADDPAGLVISETLRAQIVGMDQAMANTQDGIAMIQTAEGALTEMHSLLHSMRSLALHAANTASTTSDAIAADQEQLDSAIDSIDRIAQSTAYAGKKLLDGTAGTEVTILQPILIESVNVDTAPAETTLVDIVITDVATQAVLTGGATYASEATALGTSGAVVINGESFSFVTATTVSEFIDSINTTLANVEASYNTGTDLIVLTQANYGSSYNIVLTDAEAVILTGGGVDEGTDVEGTINATGATGDGWTLTADLGTDWAGTKVTFEITTVSGTYDNAFKVVSGQLTFQIGAEQAPPKVTPISNMLASKLGTTTDSLNDLKSGGDHDLDTDADTAILVIDAAITDVSDERAKLGALQANVLESNLRNLSISRENLQASEARIRDVDMAKEMMEFTKNNVLTQAATAMLAQANVLPQLVLRLLG